jgi:hypothetical protein
MKKKYPELEGMTQGMWEKLDTEPINVDTIEKLARQPVGFLHDFLEISSMKARGIRNSARKKAGYE